MACMHPSCGRVQGKGRTGQQIARDLRNMGLNWDFFTCMQNLLRAQPEAGLQYCQCADPGESHHHGESAFLGWFHLDSFREN